MNKTIPTHFTELKIKLFSSSSRVKKQLWQLVQSKRHTFINWSKLGVFGNSSIGKLVVLSPFIAQAIIYSSSFFEERLGISNVLWLYWSLIFISIGQVLFYLNCPDEIKKYGGDTTQFKLDSLQSLHEYKFSEIHNDWLKTWFKNVNHKKYFEFHSNPNHIVLDLPPIKWRDNEDVGDLISKDANERLKLQKQWSDEYWKFRKNITEYYAYDDIDWAVLNEVYEKHNILFGIKSGNSYSPILPIGWRSKKADETRWKTEALTWYMDRLDLSKPKFREYIAALYAIGSIYFLWNIPKAVLNMFRITLEGFF